VGIEFNVVTLTAIILALGLLLDDTVVVMENIERHYSELGKDILTTPIFHIHLHTQSFHNLK